MALHVVVSEQQGVLYIALTSHGAPEDRHQSSRAAGVVPRRRGVRSVQLMRSESAGGAIPGAVQPAGMRHEGAARSL